jgi:PAS domain S-box-containing protein
MWVTSEPLNAEDANRALKKKVKNLDDYIKKGQLEILDYSRWYTGSGHFQPDRVLKGWVTKERQALKRGFDGLRLTGNTFWLGKRNWSDFTDYEAAVNSIIGKYRMLAVCTYCLDKCTASEIIDVVSNHQFALIKQDGKWRRIESSERKRAEEKVAQLAKFPDENPNPVLRVSREGTILYSNKAGVPLLNLWQCRDSQPLSGRGHQCVLRALDDGLPRQAEVGCDSRIFSLTFAPVADSNYVNVYALDITERKQAEVMLQASENKFRDLIETTTDWVWEVDAEGTYTYVSPKVNELLGYDVNDVLGKTPFDFMPKEEADKVAKIFKEKVIKKEPFDRLENINRHKDGHLVVLETSGIPLLGEEGQLEGYRGIDRDITQRKQAEQKIRELNEKLEKRVVERTARLTRAHKQLLKEIEERKCLEKELLSISEREQRLIGQELHDSIGQQFAGIAFMAKVLEQKLVSKLPDEAANAAEIAKLVNQATDQARDLAKGLHPVDLDAGSLLFAMQELAAATEHLFGIRCTLKAGEHIPIDDTTVAIHLYRITQEAITNAIKHSRAKNIQIALTAGSDKSVLTVESDGLDFPEVVVKGTGMGLQIMDHRAEMIHGSLNICRSDRSGTILTCMFPNKKQ